MVEKREFHPDAAIFPLMGEEELRRLAEDIQAHGLREPICLHPDGTILDGRNRYLACEKAGVTPEYWTWEGDGSAVEFVASMNLHRRHLTPSQRAVLALKIRDRLAESAREHQAHGQTAPGKTLCQKVDKAIDALGDAARVAGVNRQYVADAVKLRKEAPEKLERVEAGEVTLRDAVYELGRERREAKRAANTDKVADAADINELVGERVFNTIVIDPPWPWGQATEVKFGRGIPYATISLEDIAELPVGELADVDAHLYLWTTNQHIRYCWDILEGWGFRYVTLVTWCKPHYGIGSTFRGSTEHVFFGMRGSQRFERHDVGTWFEWPKAGAHSTKPPEFMELVESCSPGPYLEMFSRNARAGWVSWGEDGLQGEVSADPEEITERGADA